MKHFTGASLTLMMFGAAAGCLLAQDVAPRPRVATNRSVFIRKSNSSYLGIGVAEIDAERAKALNLKEVRGVEVKSVDPNSPAAKAGLKESDVVLEYNGQRIEGTEQFVRLVRETPSERQVKLQVWHNGANETLTATIGHRSDHMALLTPDGDQDLSLELPAMPPVPEMPPVPAIAPMPDVWMGDVLRGRSSMLGVECEPLTSQLAAFFGVKEGVLVREVFKGSAADKAGIRAGDVIVKIAGESVTNPREISSALRAGRSSQTVPVVLVRDKKETVLNVTFESRRGMRPVVYSGRAC